MAVRLLVAALLLALLLPWTIRSIPRPLRLGPVLVLALGGATFWLAAFAEFEGLTRLPAGMLVVLLATGPVWVALIGWVVWRRVPGTVFRFALVFVVGGVSIMAAPLNASLEALGVLAGLTSAVCFAVFLVLLESNRSVPTVLGFQLGMIGAAILTLALDPGSIGRLTSEGPDPGLVAAIGVAAALWAVLLGLGLAATDSVTTAIVVAVEPLVVAILAFVILDEGLLAREIVGGAVVLVAVAAVAIQVGRAGEASGERVGET